MFEHREKESGERTGFATLAPALAELGRDFHRRGWALGTSGNFSAVISREPLRMAITSSGVDKGALTARQILEIDEKAEPVGSSAQPSAQPSAEARLHVAVARVRAAGAVLHTHSVWSTILSEACAGRGGVSIEGYEMLKGLDGVSTHEHREWLPILENSQDAAALARAVERTLEENPRSHGFLLRRHGLYTWGGDLQEAKRHVEILEFLLEVLGRTWAVAGRGFLVAGA